MKIFSIRAVLAAVFLGAASLATASPIPPVVDPNGYVGNYDISNAKTGSHGLYLPGLITGFGNDKHWSVTSGTSNYDGTSMVMKGSISNTVGGNLYTMDYSFKVFQTSVTPAAPYCGNGQACQNITPTQAANMVYFDMNGNASMGKIKGTGTLSGLVIDIEMRPLNLQSAYKPGQLGFGGNWFNLEFGYSNWLDWTVLSNTSGVNTNNSGGGDINFDFTGNGNTETINPIPLPAGLPLLLAGLGGLALMRRRAS